MKREWLQHTILRAASLLAPSDRRAGWVQEWQSELWYIPQRGATLFCLGAFHDALWLRRNSPGPAGPAGSHLESPLRCLAFLSALAAVGLSVAACLLGPLRRTTTLWHLRARDLPAACVLTFLLSCLLLPAILALGRAPMPRPGRLRRGIFLALKLALVQPILLCGLFAWILIAPVAPFAPLAIFAAWILALRWVFTDQRQRCPVCLRLLTNPVRIGTPSQTFLEWYGAESVCPRGHGLLQTQASPAANQQWLQLDASWSGLFLEAAGRRQA